MQRFEAFTRSKQNEVAFATASFYPEVWSKLLSIDWSKRKVFFMFFKAKLWKELLNLQKIMFVPSQSIFKTKLIYYEEKELYLFF